MPSRSLARLVFPLALLVAAPALGCAGASHSSSTAMNVPGGTRAPVAPNAHGPVRLLGDALGDVPLTPDQRTQIEQLAADAEARHATARAAGKDLVEAIATQVEAGSIDRAALQPKVGAVAAAMQGARPADRAALERLHAILSSDQRVAFADAVEARMHGPHGGPGDGDRGHGGAGGLKRGGHPLQQWAADLNLSDEQRSRIRAILEEAHEKMPKGEHPRGGGWTVGGGRGAKVFEAFKQDRFVMDEVAPAPADADRRAAEMGGQFLDVAARILPVLTPEQRAIAARKLREHAEDAHGGPMPTLGGL
jgi:Spy/CpxP family protein refolding chaperone